LWVRKGGSEGAAFFFLPLFLLLGPPGSGKGSQADILKAQYPICHLSTGDMLRDAVKNGTDLGKKAKPLMEAGKLVPDELIIGLIQAELKRPACLKVTRASLSGACCSRVRRGFFWTAFRERWARLRRWTRCSRPRRRRSVCGVCEKLENSFSQVTAAFEFKIEDNLLVQRITGRLTHKASGRTYHVIFAPPKVPGKDDVTGEPLEKRSDDNEAALRTRLEGYHKYTRHVCLCVCDGVVVVLLFSSGQDVFSRVCAVVSDCFFQGKLFFSLESLCGNFVLTSVGSECTVFSVAGASVTSPSTREESLARGFELTWFRQDVLAHYSKQGVLHTLAAERSKQFIADQIKAALAKH
jgi:adenylate kinase